MAFSDHRVWRGVAWMLALVCWLFLTASLLGFNPADPPTHTVFPANSPVRNWCGPAGATLAYTAIRTFGAGVWIIVLGIGMWLGVTAAGYRVGLEWLRIVGLVILAAALGSTQGVLFPHSGPFPNLAGGTVGEAVAHLLNARFHTFGSLLILLALTAIGAVVAFDKWVILAPMWLGKKAQPIASKAGAGAVAGAWTGASVAGGVATEWADGVRSRISDATARRHEPNASRVRQNDIDDDEDIPEIDELPHRQRKTDRPERKRTRNAKKHTQHQLVDADDEADLETEDTDGATKPKRSERAKSRASKKRRSSRDGKGASKTRRIEHENDADDSHDAVGAYAEDHDNYDNHDEHGGTPDPEENYTPEELREKIAKLPVVFATNTQRVATDEDLASLQTQDMDQPYEYPPLDLLVEPEKNFSKKLEELVREQAEALEAALHQYRIKGEVVGIESGPVITLYDVRLAPGTKVSSIQAVASDIARALKSVNVRIVANQVGRDTIGIEVPNPTKEKVRLKELMSSSGASEKMKLPMFLGKDAAGEPLIADLTKMPHMLIAGTTGSGKSVCMNTIIMSFLYTKLPTELRLVLVDPKMVEMSQFKDIPHLMCPVVTEMSKATAILEWAVRKMDERYELLAEAGCRDISAYNTLEWETLKERLQPATEEDERRIPRRLPFMVFVIDELADLMMTNKEVEGSIIRIAQKARAVGIHMILATQRPQANVVTGLIKSNMPCRLTFKVSSGMDSRIVLDQKGGELLLGQGDMLYQSPSSSELVRAQGTLVDDVEIRKVVRFIRDRSRATFDPALVSIRGDMTADEQRLADSENNSSASLQSAQEDPLFERAVEIVLESKRGSVSLLQRRLAIGYTRASRLIDLMGIAGIIGEHKGSVAREVAITPTEWHAMKEQAARDAAEGKLPDQEGQGALFAETSSTGDDGARHAHASADSAEQVPFDVSSASAGPFDDGVHGTHDTLNIREDGADAVPFEEQHAAVQVLDRTDDAIDQGEEDEHVSSARRPRAQSEPVEVLAPEGELEAEVDEAEQDDDHTDDEEADREYEYEDEEDGEAEEDDEELEDDEEYEDEEEDEYEDDEEEGDEEDGDEEDEELEEDEEYEDEEDDEGEEEELEEDDEYEDEGDEDDDSDENLEEEEEEEEEEE